MLTAKWAVLGVGWIILFLPIINKATEYALVNAATMPFFFGVCWLIGGPLVLYAKFKMK